MKAQRKPLSYVTNRGLNDMRCFRGGLTLGVHKIPFLEFSPITSSLSARIDSTFRAIETYFTPYFSKRNRLRCFTQAGYCLRKVNQFLEITHDQRADKFRCTDAVLLGQNLHFDQRAMWFWIKFVLSGTLATQECRVY